MSALFAAAVFFGGWLFFGIAAGCALFLSCLVGYFQVRFRRRLLTALEAVAEGNMLSEADAGLFDGFLFSWSEDLSIKQKMGEFYKETFKGLGSPALVCDKQGVIVLATKSMLALVRKKEDQVVGFSVSRALYDKNGVSVTEKALKSGKPVEDTLDLQLWDGRIVPVELFVSFVHATDGETLGAVTSFIDLTDRMEHQRELDLQQERMQQASVRISGLAEHVASATELLSASADDLAQGAQKQRRQTASVATAMEEMTSTVLEVAQNATVTSEAAEEANESAVEGVSMVNNAVSAINQVAESAQLLGKEVDELDHQAAEIGKIISVINDIADQTNLLALNAAIEAARAGEAGRGFAVVADEVRKLAEKTMDATKQVETAIISIQDRSRNATSSMQATAVKVEESTDLSNKAGEALQHIMNNIQDMVSRVAQIATAAEEQSSAAEEIMRNVEEIAVIAEDADEAAGQAADATRDMAELARDLLTVSKEFGKGDGSGELKLRKSDGQMKGVLLKLTQEYVLQTFGKERFASMQESMGNPVFLPTDSYPDEVLTQMAELVARDSGKSTREFFIGLGRYTVVRFHEMYPVHFKKESLKEFYLRMNDVHAQLTKAQPGIKPPRFTYEDKGDDLFMNYRSTRGLFDYFEGILLGAAAFKGEKVRIAVKPFDKETARAEIEFLGKA
ncbi:MULTISPECIES: methyl-accepting chemotaxis protein [unclassified Pseudodesulfovibrio]|uniref:methyl-accepting chemotaxis protein n=1 Tax=unclassified Pseudodesulfovibrio TaxID=2661612 RepID=UPI001F4FD7C1|nr:MULTISPECIES: methyl-accepting chemotaxis protein [unclassified Pseudodesulfovibrio]MCJ2163665.1 methyl-accepting chemotaxis protein [Pseudodesulfovibrio sp. S3-i]